MAKDANDILREGGPGAVRKAQDGARPFKSRSRQANGAGNLPAPTDGSPKPMITATPFVWIDPAKIPERRWIYGGHYIRDHVALTVAAPKVGKTSLSLAEALAIATGKPILNITPRERCKVWFWNGEDPQEELQRRVAALVISHGIRPDEVEGWLLLDSGRDQELIIAEQTKDGVKIASPLEEHLISHLRKLEIGVLIIDPFISCHNVAENDNNAIDAVSKTWGRIAGKAHCAVELIHHSRKTGGNDVGIIDGRGGYALVATTRTNRALNRMSKEEADKFDIPQRDRRRFIRTDDADGNLMPPDEETVWHEIKNVSLPNGDAVGAVHPWKPPGLFHDVEQDALSKVQKHIAAGKYRANSQSKAEPWVGEAVAEVLDLDLSDPAAKKRVQDMIKVWLGNGALKAVKQSNDKRELKDYIEVGIWA
jgi:RecA-family ATPase